MAAPNIWLDANVRSMIGRDVLTTANQMLAEHRPLADVARAIVARVDSTPGFSAAVIDDAGKLIAGSNDIAQSRPPAFHPPPEHRRPSRLGEPRAIYDLRPATSNGITFFAWPLSSVKSPPSMVRIPGGLVVFNAKHDALASIQDIERALVAMLVLGTFALVWAVVRATLYRQIGPIDRVRAALLNFSQSEYTRLEALSPEQGALTGLVDAYNCAANEMAGVLRRQAEVETKMRQFVADAGHELRTPLAVIMGYVQLLRKGARHEDPMADRVFSEIDDQGQRMSVLIHKMLMLTRLESQEPRDVKILDAADVARGVVDSFRPLADGSVLDFSAQDGSFVQASESELRESIGNMLDNALKYAPGATISTTVRGEGDSIYVSVSDDGPGMSPDVRARAFERFARGETAGSISGSGLGLSIVERAAQRAGGSVTLDTALSKGTKVEMRLPAWQPATRN